MSAMQGQPSDYALEMQPMPDGVLVAIAGELDVACARSLRASLLEALQEAPSNVRVDFSDVHFLDSTIVGLLVSMKQNVNGYGGVFSIQCGTQSLLALGIRGLLDYLNVDPAGQPGG